MFPGKESPWSVLGLESETATLRDVKRAYAKLLKQHRPDADPEGFRRVHEAYTTVLHELELKERGESPDDAPPLVSIPFSSTDLDSAVPAPAAPAVPAVDLPPAFAAALADLRICSGVDTAAQPLEALRAACGDDILLWREWNRFVTEFLDSGAAALGVAAIIPPRDVLWCLKGGGGDAPTRILDVWHRGRAFDTMAEVGMGLTAKGAAVEYDNPASGFFALRLAFKLALNQPGGANMLIDSAFRWIPSHSRASAMRPVENRLEIGRLFWHVPATWQPFWESVFDDLDAGRTPDWSSPDARRAVNDLLRTTPADWPGWGFLKSQLSEAQWNNILGHFNSRPPSRRSWAAPPAKAWLNAPARASSAGMPFKSRHPDSAAPAEEDEWNIPEAVPVEVRPRMAGSGEKRTAPARQTADAPSKTRHTPAPSVEEPTGFWWKVSNLYYRMPRSVRILLLCSLTWLLVFGLAYLARLVSR